MQNRAKHGGACTLTRSLRRVAPWIRHNANGRPNLSALSTSRLSIQVATCFAAGQGIPRTEQAEANVHSIKAPRFFCSDGRSQNANKFETRSSSLRSKPSGPPAVVCRAGVGNVAHEGKQSRTAACLEVHRGLLQHVVAQQPHHVAVLGAAHL